jgi:hypothetical protein
VKRGEREEDYSSGSEVNLLTDSEEKGEVHLTVDDDVVFLDSCASDKILL